VVIK
jgi:hypothetical protein